ncbi:MAG: hypothetical protein H0V34_01070 [Gammaproteobacteria bacterium]|nr:hypothetical protein [Gammaproteobacteria bacterium]
MAENVSRRKRADITREMVQAAMIAHPDKNRHQIAAPLRCSEQLTLTLISRHTAGNPAA